MKIGMLSKFGEDDGIAIYSDSLVKSLRTHGVEVTTIGDEASKSDYRISLKSFFLRKEIEKIIVKEKLDLIHIQYIAARSYYGLHTLNLNLLQALRQKVPVIVTMHEVHYSAYGIKALLVKKLEKEVIGKASAVIVFTNSQRNFINKSYKKRSEVIRMGVSLHPLHEKKGKRLLFFGLVCEAKGIEYMIGAMDNLEGHSLTIAGKVVSTKYAEKLLVLMKKAANRSIIADFGWVPEGRKHEYFDGSDILVLPYVSAPYQSAVLHDAVSFGLPVVVTMTGPISEIVQEFSLGEVVPPRDSFALAQAVRKVDKNYASYQAGIKRYRKEAEWGRVALKHVDVYRSLI